jgi:RNA polymerase sigma-70 factor (ECF subfamily)
VQSIAIQAQINDLYRSISGKMIASLVSYFGLSNLALAEDLVQETFFTALEQWSSKGIPENPQAWLFKVCKNKAINALTRKTARPVGIFQLTDEAKADDHLERLFLDHEIKDNQLRLLFACCHHNLSPRAQVVLILKNICGLKVEEIARALASTDEAIMKMCTRSRQILIDKKVVLHVPFLLRSRERLNVVHTAIYLLFNEGYQATEGNEAIRKDLCLEAVRLVKSITDIPEIRTTDTYALMALLCFHTARFNSRISNGELIDLENQDRQKWDHELIELGFAHFKKTVGADPSRFILEAAIASVHCLSKKIEDTNWNTIRGLYDQLRKIQSSPFIDINRATAIFFNEGSRAALDALKISAHLNWLKNYYLYHVLLGKIYKTEKAYPLAISHYEKALALTNLPLEKDFLKKQIDIILRELTDGQTTSST